MQLKRGLSRSIASCQATRPGAPNRKCESCRELRFQVFLEGGGNQDALLQKEEAGVKSEDTIRMYNELVK